MRVSRAVSLSVLTLGLTVGGIGVAAADSATTLTSSTTAAGDKSGFTHSTDDSYVSGSNSTTAAGVADSLTEAGVAKDGAGYYRSTSTHVTDEGITHTGTFESTGPTRQHGDDEWSQQGDRRWGEHRDDCDKRRGGHDDEHEGLLGDVLEDLL